MVVLLLFLAVPSWVDFIPDPSARVVTMGCFKGDIVSGMKLSFNGFAAESNTKHFPSLVSA